MELTEQEKDLIQMTRNFRRARPNGEDEMIYYIYQLVDELLHD